MNKALEIWNSYVGLQKALENLEERGGDVSDAVLDLQNLLDNAKGTIGSDEKVINQWLLKDEIVYKSEEDYDNTDIDDLGDEDGAEGSRYADLSIKE